MQRTMNFSLLLSVALSFGLVQLLGCAAPGEPMVVEGIAEAPAPEEAVEPAPSQALEMLPQAQQAYDDEDYGRARELFSAIQQDPQGLSEEQVARVGDRLTRIESILHQRRLEEEQKAAEAVAAAEAPEPEPEPLEPEVAQQKALELLAAVKDLCAQKKFEEAASQADALDRLRQYLSIEQKADHDDLRALVQQTTQKLEPLSRREKAQRAEEHFDAGLAAYRGKDYVTASRHLGVAAAFDVGIGLWDNRTLRKVREKVDTTLEQLRDDCVMGRELYDAGDYAEATAVLQSVKDSGINIGAEEAEGVDDLLADIPKKVAELEEQRAGELADRVAGLLAGARALCDDAKHAEAGDKLAELAGLTDALADEQRQEYDDLCAQVEEATGIMPGMSPEQKLAKARQYFDWGMKAHKAKRYASAQENLDRAAKLDVSLGRRRDRTLSNTRQEVNETLEQLRADYATGKDLYADGNYAEAQVALEKVKASGINIGDEEAGEIDDLLADITETLARQRAKRAAALLAEAQALGAQSKYAEASAKLGELTPLTEDLTPEQRADYDRLCAIVASATEVAEVRAQLEQAEGLAAQATELLQIQSSVQAKEAAADAALAQGDLEAARRLLAEAQQQLEAADVTALPALADVAGGVEEKLAFIDAQIERKARLESVRRRLDALVAEARALVSTDLLAAEKKTLEALDLAEQEGVALTEQQMQVRQAVLDAVEARYGIARRLRPEQYAGLAEFSDLYRRRGEHHKAGQILALVEQAPAELVTEDYRNLASGKLTAAEWSEGQQEEIARGLIGLLAQCEADLERGELEQALRGAERAVQMARDENLAGAAMAELLRNVVSFLQEDLEQAMTAAQPELKERVAAALAGARVAMACKLAEFYLEKNGPDLAEPYLKGVAAAGAAEPERAEWAKGRLALIEQLKAEAEQLRLLQVKTDAKRVLDLATELHELARAGQLAEARAVEQKLADARLELQVKSAQNALGRGAYTEAVRLLDEAPVEKAGDSVVSKVHRPVVEQVGRLSEVALHLQAAEDALAAGEIPTATARLRRAEAAEVESVPLDIKKDALAGVVDSVVQLTEEQMALRAQQKRALDRIGADLEAERLRQEAWKRYYEALRSFLAAEEGGADTLRRIVAEQPAGLLEFELDDAREIVEALAGAEAEPAVADAQSKLAEAEVAHAAGRSMAASAMLDELRAMPGFALSEAIRRDADQLAEAIQGKEERAEQLYARAVEAKEAGDPGRVRELIAELKAGYSGTKVFRRHR